jgi:hypothetical protein
MRLSELLNDSWLVYFDSNEPTLGEVACSFVFVFLSIEPV